MVGSPNPVPALYSDGDAGLARVLRSAAGDPLGKVTVGGASDHAPFEEAGVPVNGLYTGSSERGPGGRPRDACYHLACDTVDNVDRPVLLRMARAGSGGTARPIGTPLIDSALLGALVARRDGTRRPRPWSCAMFHPEPWRP